MNMASTEDHTPLKRQRLETETAPDAASGATALAALAAVAESSAEQADDTADEEAAAAAALGTLRKGQKQNDIDDWREHGGESETLPSVATAIEPPQRVSGVVPPASAPHHERAHGAPRPAQAPDEVDREGGEDQRVGLAVAGGRETLSAQPRVRDRAARSHEQGRVDEVINHMFSNIRHRNKFDQNEVKELMRRGMARIQEKSQQERNITEQKIIQLNGLVTGYKSTMPEETTQNTLSYCGREYALIEQGEAPGTLRVDGKTYKLVGKESLIPDNLARQVVPPGRDVIIGPNQNVSLALESLKSAGCVQHKSGRTYPMCPFFYTLAWPVAGEVKIGISVAQASTRIAHHHVTRSEMGWAMIVTAGGRCDIPTLRSFEMFIKFYIYLQSRRGKHPWIMDGGTEVFRNAELSTVLSFSARLEQFKKHGRVALEAAPSGNEASTMASVISFSGVESVGDPSDFRKHPQYEDFWKIVSNLPCFYDGETGACVLTQI